MKIKLSDKFKAKAAVVDRRVAWAARQKEKGLCIRCPEALAEGNKNYCTYHATEAANYQKQYLQRVKEREEANA